MTAQTRVPIKLWKELKLTVSEMLPARFDLSLVILSEDSQPSSEIYGSHPQYDMQVLNLQ